MCDRRGRGATPSGGAAIAVARDVAGDLDHLARAQLAPASADKLVAADGLEIVEAKPREAVAAR